MTLNCSYRKDWDICNCPQSVLINCPYEKTKKIPRLEIKFLYDQKHKRIGQIVSVDKKITKVFTKRLKRKNKEQTRHESAGTVDVLIDNASQQQPTAEVEQESLCKENTDDDVFNLSTWHLYINLKIK